MVEPVNIKRLAADLGFALCGICDARVSDHVDEFRGWIADGKHGEMAWLADHVEERMDPRKFLPGARSIIVVADAIEMKVGSRKAEGGSEEQTSGFRLPTSHFRIARYATVPDYHVTIKKRLHRLADAMHAAHPSEMFRATVDTAPILEREHAMRAGLGWVGKNTLLLNPRKGSHLLLGEIVTTLHIAPDEPETDHCGRCTRCVDACPTDAITPYSVDATRCISYLTIEHRSLIDKQFHEAMGDWVFGCDICQEVCPFVRSRDEGKEAERDEGTEGRRDEVGSGSASFPSSLRPFVPSSLLSILHWAESDRRAAFTRSAMKRVKLHQFKRNALIVAGNHLKKRDDPALRRCIKRIAGDENEHPLVRDTARQVMGILPGA
ncbi:MAG: tRNA epoxyqueuosine(34) reductase QueG [Phycisphaeraceae bacterium]